MLILPVPRRSPSAGSKLGLIIIRVPPSLLLFAVQFFYVVEMESGLVENLLSSVTSIRVGFPDGSVSEVESSLNILCALAIVKGVSSVSDLFRLLAVPVTSDEWQSALKIINNPAHSGAPLYIDVHKVVRDNKYALQVQDLLDYQTPASISRIIHGSIQGNVLRLSLDSFGCRVIQKLMDVGTSEDCMRLVHPEISTEILNCTLDVNGNHVVQKMIDRLPSSECQFIVDAIIGDLARICVHGFGCRVVQRIIARCKSPQTDQLLEAVCADAGLISLLCSDKFGNYVVQHALEYGRLQDRDRITFCLASLGDFVQLACCKYASNVVEKAIRINNKPSPVPSASLRLLLMRIVNEPSVLALMKDRYGNYVVRAIAELANPDFGSEVEQTKKIILVNAHILKKFPFSWHLVDHLGKRNHGL